MDSDENKKARTSGRAGVRKSSGKSRDGTVGNALRSVYDDTLQESIPSDLLDLLGKLS